MRSNVPSRLQARLYRVAIDLLWRAGGPRIDDAVLLAEELVAAGFTDDCTVAVASLRRDAIRSDAEPILRDMLATFDIELPDTRDEAAQFRVLLHALGFWDLPFADFYAPFLHQLPAWDEQTSLERSLIRLLDDLDHATDPAEQADVVQRMRAAVRSAESDASLPISPA